MPSSISEKEKVYGSINLDKDSFKRDYKDVKNSYTMKIKRDIITPVIFIVGLFFIILGILMFKKPAVLALFLIVGILIIVGGVVYLKLFSKKKQERFIEYYSKAISATHVIKHEDDLQISDLFPIRARWNNVLKLIEIIYGNEKIKVCYDDILNYTILKDDKDLEVSKLPMVDYNSNSYSVLITFNNKTRGEIKFSNRINNLKKDNKFEYLSDSNMKSVNKIAELLDKIIFKNRIE